MCKMSTGYRREYIAELCDRLVPNLNDELKLDDMKPFHEAVKDLVIRLTHASDWFRQCKKKGDK